MDFQFIRNTEVGLITFQFLPLKFIIVGIAKSCRRYVTRHTMPNGQNAAINKRKKFSVTKKM